MPRLAIIATHPIQYYSPWFRHLAAVPGLELRVFYLWDFGVQKHTDPGFDLEIVWDIPLLDGYEYEFVPNTSTHPGTGRFNGLCNPTLRRAVLGWKPDAVFLMAYRYRSTLEFILRRPRGLPLLFRGDSHRLGEQEKGPGNWLRRAIITRIFSRFDAVLCVGSANRDYFQMHGVGSERVFSCPHCVDNERLFASRETATRKAQAWRRELGIAPGNAVILFAGKFIAAKRPLDLLEAFKRADCADASLVFVGAGKLAAKLREAASGDARVHLVPFQNQSDMPRVFALADLMVLPSNFETWGLILNEAMCLAKPLIASDLVGAAHDLIEPGVNGLIFPAGDTDALARALREALSDRQRLAQWGARSEAIIASYTYEQATRGLLEALDHCLPAGKSV